MKHTPITQEQLTTLQADYERLQQECQSYRKMAEGTPFEAAALQLELRSKDLAQDIKTRFWAELNKWLWIVGLVIVITTVGGYWIGFTVLRQDIDAQVRQTINADLANVQQLRHEAESALIDLKIGIESARQDKQAFTKLSEEQQQMLVTATQKIAELQQQFERLEQAGTNTAQAVDRLDQFLLPQYLLDAIRKGDTAAVKTWIEKGADVNIQDHNGNPAIIVAIMENQPEILQLLLTSGSQVDRRNSYDQTGLIVAAAKGDQDAVQTLLSNKADVMASDSNGLTALLWAAGGGYPEIVRMLLDQKADIEVENSIGQTALIGAVLNGQKPTIQILLEHGANVNARDREGRTALMGAVALVDAEVVRILLEAHADVTLQDFYGMTALDVALRAIPSKWIPGQWIERDGQNTWVPGYVWTPPQDKIQEIIGILKQSGAVEKKVSPTENGGSPQN